MVEQHTIIGQNPSRDVIIDKVLNRKPYNWQAIVGSYRSSRRLNLMTRVTESESHPAILLGEIGGDVDVQLQLVGTQRVSIIEGNDIGLPAE